MAISPSDLHLDSWLADYFIQWGNDMAGDFIGRQSVANVRSNRKKGKIMVGGKEHMRIWDLERAPGEEAARLKFELGTAIDFEANPLEAKDLVTKEMREIAESEGTPYRPFMHKTRDLREALEVRLEVKIASLIRGFADDALATQNLAGTYNASHYATPGTKWSTVATATPFSEIRTAKNQVFTACGRVANTIIIPQTVAETLVETAEYRARLSTNRDILTMGQVLPELRGMNVIIPKSQYYNGTSLAEIWGDDVWVGYVDPNPSPEMTFSFAAMVQYTGPQATTNKVTVEDLLPSDRQTSQVWATLGEFDFVYLVKECGYLIYDTLA